MAIAPSASMADFAEKPPAESLDHALATMPDTEDVAAVETRIAALSAQLQEARAEVARGARARAQGKVQFVHPFKAPAPYRIEDATDGLAEARAELARLQTRRAEVDARVDAAAHVPGAVRPRPPRTSSEAVGPAIPKPFQPRVHSGAPTVNETLQANLELFGRFGSGPSPSPLAAAVDGVTSRFLSKSKKPKGSGMFDLGAPDSSLATSVTLYPRSLSGLPGGPDLGSVPDPRNRDELPPSSLELVEAALDRR